MKATVQGGAGVSLEVEGGNQKELFENIAAVSEVFGVQECGACHDKNFKFVVRNVDKEEKGKTKSYRYYEYHCTNPKCRAKLAFGSHQEGSTLFPKRKDDEGKWLPNNGWTIYVKEN